MDDNQDDFNPNGTLVVLAIYLVVIIVLWTTVYLVLTSRGLTL
ncbi:MAG: cytochrome c oxidase subunit 2A [Anaerolineae bacterium]